MKTCLHRRAGRCLGGWRVRQPARQTRRCAHRGRTVGPAHRACQRTRATVSAGSGVALQPGERARGHRRPADRPDEPRRRLRPGPLRSQYRELIDRGAVAMLGYVGTASSLAALPMVTAEERLFFVPFTGSEAIRIPFNPLAFHVRASYVDETNAIVKHLTSVGTQWIGVFYQNDGDGKAGLLGVARALKRQYQSSVGLGFVQVNSCGSVLGGEVHPRRPPGCDRADRHLFVVRCLHPRGAAGGVRRRLLQHLAGGRASTGAGTVSRRGASW